MGLTCKLASAFTLCVQCTAAEAENHCTKALQLHECTVWHQVIWLALLGPSFWKTALRPMHPAMLGFFGWYPEPWTFTAKTHGLMENPCIVQFACLVSLILIE